MLKISERNKIERSLIEQAELLHKASNKGIYDDGLSRYSHEITEIYKALVSPFRYISFSFMLFNFFVSASKLNLSITAGLLQIKIFILKNITM